MELAPGHTGLCNSQSQRFISSFANLPGGGDQQREGDWEAARHTKRRRRRRGLLNQFFQKIKWAILVLFSVYFCFFKQTIQIMQQNNVRKCPSSIRHWALNS